VFGIELRSQGLFTFLAGLTILLPLCEHGLETLALDTSPRLGLEPLPLRLRLRPGRDDFDFGVSHGDLELSLAPRLVLDLLAGSSRARAILCISRFTLGEPRVMRRQLEVMILSPGILSERQMGRRGVVRFRGQSVCACASRVEANRSRIAS